MHKKKLIFVGLLALVLCSCSLTETSSGGSKKKQGKQISEEEGIALFNEFKQKGTGEVGPYRLDYSVTGTSGAYNVKQEYVLMSNSKNDFYYSSIAKELGAKTSDCLAVQVNNETYEQVSYIKNTTYSTSGTKDEEFAITKKDNPNYESTVNSYIEANLTEYSTLQETAELVMTGEKYNVEYLTEVTEEYNAMGYKIEIEYRTLGTGSLILNVKTLPNDSSVVDRYSLTRGDETITFSNYRFSEIVSKNYYSGGGLMTITMKMTYEDPTISLPAGWESKLVTD